MIDSVFLQVFLSITIAMWSL